MSFDNPYFLSSAIRSGRTIHRRKKTVLLAEDDGTMRKIVTWMLERMGYGVVCAANGADAVSALEREGFDLILMDCEMPVLDGIEASRQIRDREKKLGVPRTPLIALTAHVLTWARAKCLEVGMDDYLAKPIDIAKFEDCIRTWIPMSIDTDYLKNLGELQLKGQPDIVLSTIGTFERQAPGMIGRMRQYFANGLAKSVADEAGKLKASAECVGARKLCELCSHVEAAAVRGDLSKETGRSVRAIDVEFQDVLDELRVEKLRRKKEIR